MKISEVIEKLKELQETHGDLDCVIVNEFATTEDPTFPVAPKYYKGEIVF